MGDTKMLGYYSPVWFDSYLPWQRKPRRVTSIKFTPGERLKYCKRCDDYHPADTEFFNVARSTKVGLSPWCRACNSENQNEKKYWLVVRAAITDNGGSIGF